MRTLRPSIAAAAILPAITALVLVGPSAPASAAASTVLRCSASMTNRHPADYTSTGVRIRTARHAHIKTVAHYKTTSHPKYATANSRGHRTVWYYISGATPGYQVIVDVYVSRGSRSGSCQTSFVPHT
jgi:hypothetical protein